MENLKGEEEWRLVPGYAGYEVSSLGRVRSIDRLTYLNRRLCGKVLRTQPLPSGYLRVNLCGKSEYVHRLVLTAFVGACPSGMEGAHDDGNKSNNCLSNLKWKTHQENCDDRYAHGTVQYGTDNPVWTGDQCGRGHAYTKENTRLHVRGKNIVRHCRTCARERSRSSHLSPGKVFMTAERIEASKRMLAEGLHIADEILPALKAIKGPNISRAALYVWTKNQKRLLVPAHSLEDK